VATNGIPIPALNVDGAETRREGDEDGLLLWVPLGVKSLGLLLGFQANLTAGLDLNVGIALAVRILGGKACTLDNGDLRKRQVRENINAKAVGVDCEPGHPSTCCSSC